VAAGGGVVTVAAGGGVVTVAAGGGVVTVAAGGGVVTVAAGGGVVTVAAGGGVVTVAVAGGGVVTVVVAGGVVTVVVAGGVVTDAEAGGVAVPLAEDDATACFPKEPNLSNPRGNRRPISTAGSTEKLGLKKASNPPLAYTLNGKTGIRSSVSSLGPTTNIVFAMSLDEDQSDPFAKMAPSLTPGPIEKILASRQV